MRIFVTGGAGFIGRNLVSSLLENHSVTIYDSMENSSKKDIAGLIDSGAKFVKADVLDYDRLVESCKSHDVMIHLAAKSDVAESIKNPEKTIQVNVEGTINVAKSCVENNIQKIIFASSAAVYGNCNDLPITESSDTNPISPYGKSKIVAESEIKKISDESKLQYVILRIFNVYGKGQNESYGVITKFAQRITENKPLVIFGDGTQTRDFVSVSDVVYAFEKAIIHEKSGTYNIASGKKTSVKELADIIIESSGKKTGIVYESEIAGDIKNSYADITLAQDELGFVARHRLADEIGKVF